MGRDLGNRGDDTLAGDAGADLFFFSGGGADVIEAGGFDAAEGDRLSIPGGPTRFGQSAAGDLIILHGSGQITLLGIAPGRSAQTG